MNEYVGGYQRPRQLTCKEARELGRLPEMIEVFETEQRTLYGTMGDFSLYRTDGDAVAAAGLRLAEVEAALAKAYGRWEQSDAIDRGADAPAS